MMLAGLLVFVGGLAAAAHGFVGVAAVLFVLSLALLILARPVASVDDVIRKGNRKP